MTEKVWSTGSKTLPYWYRGAPFELTTTLLSQGILRTQDTPFLSVRRRAFSHPNPKVRAWWKRFYSRHDLGGPFSLRKWEFSHLSHENLSVTLRDGQSRYSGMNFLPTAMSQAISSVEGLVGTLPDPNLQTAGSMQDRLIGYGSKAIANSIPFESVAQMGTALLEIMPVNRFSRADFEVPEIPMKKVAELVASGPKNGRWNDYLSALGGEYLNVVFGWIPTIGDLRDTLYAVKNSKLLLEEFARRFESTYPFRETGFEDTRTFSGRSSISRAPSPGLPTSEFYGAGVLNPLIISGTVKERIWTSGEFLFHNYTHGTLWAQMEDWVAKADYLLGIRPDVEMAWELTPFSWLVDWQTNVGSVLLNASAIGRDGLALKYAYAMHSYDISVDVVNPVHVNGHFSRGPISAHLNGKVRKRIRATPYGFGITLDSLSEKQWSILAALGLTFIS